MSLAMMAPLTESRARIRPTWRRPGTARGLGALPPSAAVVAALFLLLVPTTPSPGAEEPSKAPSTLREIVDGAAQWVVALKVERSKDLARPPPAMGGPGAMTKEARAYYTRPEGWVSGLLVDREGHVVTSYYNVAGEVTSIQVMLPSGKARSAKLLSKSLLDDIALLKIDRTDSDPEIPFHEPLWADSTRLRAGQIVFALGRSPDPFKITLTRGILSAVGRNGGRAVQTDAELNYGNVGGPMIDLEGRVVAVSTFVGHTRPMWGVNSGVGFGTAASAILSVMPTLKEGKDATAFRFPFLGVRGNLEHVSPAGAKVDWVAPGGPAEKAGMKAGDLIVEFDATEVKSFDQLRQLIFRRSIGDKVKLKVRRGEETLEVEPVLKEMPES